MMISTGPLSPQAAGERPAELEFRGVSKRFGSTSALEDFTHRFAPGRVNALMGRNGSGKSTLVKIMAGVHGPTAGAMFLDGRICHFSSPQDAFAAGIVTVHQELSLIPALSIGENIFLGRLPHRRSMGMTTVDWGAVHERASMLLEDMGLQLDSRRPVSSLSVGQQQVVEIVKAMSYQPRVLLLDEPTSALATREVRQLFALVEHLRSRGVTIVYITHRMSELFEICDTCTVLRDGVHIGTVDMAGTQREGIVEMMFGAAAHATRPPRRPVARDEPVLEVQGLSRPGHFHDVSFQLYPGEILGFAGLLGSGRTEILRSIFGADRATGGSVRLHGRDVSRASPADMRRMGLGYTPENRKEEGLVQILSTADNLCMSSQERIAPAGVVTRKQEKPFVDQQVFDLAIKAGPLENPVASLSGGNQQKVVIGKWINTEPSVMFFDEPSRGVDVQAKRQIFDIIWKKAASGLAAIFVSTELEEVLEVADRILVIRDGTIVAEVDPTTTNLNALYGLCMEDAAA